MILRCVCWGIFLCLSLGPIVKAQVTVDEQGYQNIMISFAPNVPSEDGKGIVEEIQSLLQNTSSVLHKAIGIPIASATFRLPSSWNKETLKDIAVTPATPEETARKTDMRLEGTQDSPFVNQPVALQYGGCGVSGRHIILNLNFLAGPLKHPEDKLIAREWLKYRYGVFDENGYLGDPLYPLYYKIPKKPIVRVTDCTDSNITYAFRIAKAEDEVCDMADLAITGAYCKTYPDKKSAVNVTSSLMYFHKELPGMEHICGKDGRPHNSLARNKQNALCNGRSIWDVMKSSEDFKNIKPQSAPKPIKFSYIQENKPRFAVLLENTDKFLEKEIPSAIRFALNRFYYDLPPKSKLAIYTFNSDVKDALPYTELPVQGRKDLGVFADFGSPVKNICTSCGLVKAAQILLQNSEVEKGSILLITASPLDKVPTLSEKLRKSGICLHVLRFTDENNPADQTYDALAKSFYCFSQESLPMSLKVVDIFHSLTRFLKNSVPEYNNFEIQTVASGNMSSESPVTIPANPSAASYTLWLGKALSSSSVYCKAGNNILKLKPATTAAEIASFTFVPTDKNVICSLGSILQRPVLAQVQMTTQKGHYFDFDVWIHDTSTDKEQLPITIYAKIYFGEYPVKNASVMTEVTSGTRLEAVQMFDNGRGDPDITQNDGIYSGYFTGLVEKGIYQIKIKVNDNQGQAKIGKINKSLAPDACCGSTILSADYDVPAFSKDKTISYTARNKKPAEDYPPSKIRDLRIVRTYDTKVFLSWTTPGGGNAEKYVLKVFEKREDALTKFETTGKEISTSGKVPKVSGQKDGLFVPYEGLDENMIYYAAIRSWNKFKKQSETSNVVEFVPSAKEESTVSPPTTTPESSTGGGTTEHKPTNSSNKTIGIVFGVLGGIAVLCILGYLGYYFFVKKPRQN